MNSFLAPEEDSNASNVEDDYSEVESKFFQFVVKLKSPQYLEREGIEATKPIKIRTAADEPDLSGLTDLQREFHNYINQNRVINSYTKQEWPKKDLKLLVDFVVKDGLEEFLEDGVAGKFTNLTEKDSEKLKEFKDKPDFQRLKKVFDLPAKKTMQHAFILAKKMYD